MNAKPLPPDRRTRPCAAIEYTPCQDGTAIRAHLPRAQTDPRPSNVPGYVLATTEHLEPTDGR